MFLRATIGQALMFSTLASFIIGLCPSHSSKCSHFCLCAFTCFHRDFLDATGCEVSATVAATLRQAPGHHGHTRGTLAVCVGGSGRPGSAQIWRAPGFVTNPSHNYNCRHQSSTASGIALLHCLLYTKTRRGGYFICM